MATCTVQDYVQKMLGGAANVSAATIVVVSVTDMNNFHFVTNHTFGMVLISSQLHFKIEFVSVKNSVRVKHSIVHLVQSPVIQLQA